MADVHVLKQMVLMFGKMSKLAWASLAVASLKNLAGWKRKRDTSMG